MVIWILCGFGSRAFGATGPWGLGVMGPWVTGPCVMKPWGHRTLGSWEPGGHGDMGVTRPFGSGSLGVTRSLGSWVGSWGLWFMGPLGQGALGSQALVDAFRS